MSEINVIECKNCHTMCQPELDHCPNCLETLQANQIDLTALDRIINKEPFLESDKYNLLHNEERSNTDVAKETFIVAIVLLVMSILSGMLLVLNGGVGKTFTSQMALSFFVLIAITGPIIAFVIIITSVLALLGLPQPGKFILKRFDS